MNAKTTARKFVRHVRQNGARHIQVWSCGDLLNESQREADIVEAMTCTDEVTIVIRGDYETGENGLRARKFLGRCLWCSDNLENGEALVFGNNIVRHGADWRINDWSDRVFDAFYKLCEEVQL